MPYIHITRQWVHDIVIGCGFCPFAAHVYDRDLIRYRVAEKDEDLRALLLAEAAWLDENQKTDTTLVIVPHALDDFEDYLDKLDELDTALLNEGYEGVYQLASFHPQYVFAGARPDDPANYTNRAPFPLFHLLREASIDEALEHYKGDPEAIPDRNIAFARKQGTAYFKAILARLGE
ncbi:MAG TPA: DUF1415 domain-containing protein [Flavihumibacter sp.]|nr:DUF1415 domain-containing protein [Flavihumibacter sp.]